MSLLAPLMLLGLLGLALPLLGHLRGKEEPRTVRFAGLRFLAAGDEVVTQRRRLRDVLLLLVRLGLLVLLVLALTRPVSTGTARVAVLGEAHDAVLLLDASFSMNLRADDGVSLRAASEDAAAAILEALPAGSRIGLVSTDPGGPRRELSADPDRVRAAISEWVAAPPRAGAWTLESGLPRAVALLRQAGEGSQRRVIYAIGDLSSRGLASLPATAAADIPVLPVPARGLLDDPPPVPEHMSLESATWVPAREIDPRAVRISGELRRHGGVGERIVPVLLRVDGEVAARIEVVAPADGRAGFEFTHTSASPGPIPASVRTRDRGRPAARRRDPAPLARQRGQRRGGDRQRRPERDAGPRRGLLPRHRPRLQRQRAPPPGPQPRARSARDPPAQRRPARQHRRARARQPARPRRRHRPRAHRAGRRWHGPVDLRRRPCRGQRLQRAPRRAPAPAPARAHHRRHRPGSQRGPHRGPRPARPHPPDLPRPAGRARPARHPHPPRVPARARPDPRSRGRPGLWQRRPGPALPPPRARPGRPPHHLDRPRLVRPAPSARFCPARRAGPRLARQQPPGRRRRADRRRRAAPDRRRRPRHRVHPRRPRARAPARAPRRGRPARHLSPGPLQGHPAGGDLLTFAVQQTRARATPTPSPRARPASTATRCSPPPSTRAGAPLVLLAALLLLAETLLRARSRRP